MVKKLTDLATLTTADANDVVLAVDVSANTSKQVPISGLGAGLGTKTVALGSINGGATAGVLVTDASGNVVASAVSANKIDFTTFGSGETSSFTINGFSTTYAKRLTWLRQGDFVTLSIFADGVSNSSSKSVVLPFTNVGQASGFVLSYVRDNNVNDVGICSIEQDSATVVFLRGTAGSSFVASGSCRLSCSLTIKVA